MSARDDAARAAWLPRGRTLYADLALLVLALVVDVMVWDGDRQLRGGGEAPAWVVPTCASVGLATLLLRRRLPVSVFLFQVAYATVGAALMPGYNTIPGVLIGLHMVATKRRPSVSLPALAGCAVPLGLQALNSVMVSDENRIMTGVVIGTLSAIPPMTAWGIGYRSWLADRRTTELEARRAAATAQALRTERLRIARELHDILAHSVSVMVLQAAGGRTVVASNPERATEVFTVIENVGTQSMAELRRLLGLLRSAGDADGDGREWQRGIGDVGEIIATARVAGITVDESVDGVVGQLDPSVSLTAYRVVQEALTNTLKHAGAGSTANVRFTWLADRLEVVVEDRVPHRAAAQGTGVSLGYGLLGLRERVNAVGGTFDAFPVPGGFLVRATLPTAERGTPGRGITRDADLGAARGWGAT